MPREVIRSTPDDAFAVKIGWAENSPDVQLGVETGDDRPLHRVLWQSNVELIGTMVRHVAMEHRALDLGNGREREWSPDAAIGEAFLRLLDGTDVPDGMPRAIAYRGVWAHLGRSECNRLIRMLRRARDTTFGVDA